MAPIHATDPVEMILIEALTVAGISFIHGSQGDERCCGLDFFLPHLNIHIEVSRFYTERKIRQMSQAPNIIFVQGIPAAQAFAGLIKAGVR